PRSPPTPESSSGRRAGSPCPPRGECDPRPSPGLRFLREARLDGRQLVPGGLQLLLDALDLRLDLVDEVLHLQLLVVLLVLVGLRRGEGREQARDRVFSRPRGRREASARTLDGGGGRRGLARLGRRVLGLRLARQERCG